MTPMGRPKMDDPKSVVLSFRVDQETLEMLKENAEHFGETKTDTIRRAIKTVNESIKKK